MLVGRCAVSEWALDAWAECWGYRVRAVDNVDGTTGWVSFISVDGEQFMCVGGDKCAGWRLRNGFGQGRLIHQGA